MRSQNKNQTWIVLMAVGFICIIFPLWSTNVLPIIVVIKLRLTTIVEIVILLRWASIIVIAIKLGLASVVIVVIKLRLTIVVRAGKRFASWVIVIWRRWIARIVRWWLLVALLLIRITHQKVILNACIFINGIHITRCKWRWNNFIWWLIWSSLAFSLLMTLIKDWLDLSIW